jgi:hypothetical protein
LRRFSDAGSKGIVRTRVYELPLRFRDERLEPSSCFGQSRADCRDILVPPRPELHPRYARCYGPRHSIGENRLFPEQPLDTRRELKHGTHQPEARRGRRARRGACTCPVRTRWSQIRDRIRDDLRAAAEEVQVAALVGLQHVVEVELAVPAFVLPRRSSPRLAARGQLAFVNE